MALSADLFFGPATYLSASLFSFTVFLYFETLLRRHMPIIVKLFAAIGTSYFVIASIFGLVHNDVNQLKLFGAFYFLLSSITCILTIVRSKIDYSTSENRLIDLSVIALCILGPFFLTDIVAHEFPEVPRLGIVGALLFAYISLYNRALFTNRGYLLKKLFKAMGFTALSWIPIYALLPDIPLYAHVRIFLLLYIVNLIFRIWYAVKHLDGDDDFYGFVRAVSESDKLEIRTFLRGMKDYFSGVEIKILKQSDLPLYRLERWNNFYKKMKTDTVSVFDLRRFLQEEEILEEEKEVLEEMLDALESYDMSHVCLLGRVNFYLIFFQVPMVGYSSMIQLKTRLVGEFSRLIER